MKCTQFYSGKLSTAKNRPNGTGLVVRGFNEAQFCDLINLGGIYNPYLSDGPGVVFRASTHTATVAEYVANNTYDEQ